MKFRSRSSRSSTRAFHTPARSRSSKYGLNASSLLGCAERGPYSGAAPAVFAGLPAPDAIFVGGAGHEVARLLEAAYAALRPGGRMVVNVATLESLSATYAALKKLISPVHVCLVNIARGVEQLETLRFEAVNPTFLLAVSKAGA